MGWNREKAAERITAARDAITDVEVKDLVRETDLSNLALNVAYRIDGVHAYVDITNPEVMLASAQEESERTHQRYLRFLHLTQRMAQLVLDEAGAVKVDYQNHRLHFIVYRPYQDAKARAATAVAVATLIRDVIHQCNEMHEQLEDAEVAAGVEAGQTLAVGNGTRGDREALFIGDAANLAAKIMPDASIAIGRRARKDLGLPSAPIVATEEELRGCVGSAGLDVTVEQLVTRWREDLENTPLAAFKFFRPTPPLAGLDLDDLNPSRTARIDAASVVADLDGFTSFVHAAIDRGDEGTVVRGLHVLRKELRDVLFENGGRKVRYIGDAIQGVIAEPEKGKTTIAEDTVRRAVEVAAAMRSSFLLCQELVPGLDDLGLAIGVGYGPTSLSRVGKRGSKDTCAAGRCWGNAEAEQEACDGRETRLGRRAYAAAPESIQELFGEQRAKRDLTFNQLVHETSSRDEAEARKIDYTPAAPAVIRGRSHCR